MILAMTDRLIGQHQRTTCGMVRQLNAVAKCLPAYSVGTTPIVAWHEVPGQFGHLEKVTAR